MAKQPELGGISWRQYRGTPMRPPMTVTPHAPKTSGNLFKAQITPEGVDVQVPLWARASEITSELGSNYLDLRTSPVKKLKEDKIAEARNTFDAADNSLYDSIAESGVKKPVTIASAPDGSTGTVSHMLFGGHHRLFTAEHIDPNMMVPLRYDNQVERHHGQCPSCSGEGHIFGYAEVSAKSGSLPEYGDDISHHNWKNYDDQSIGHHTLETMDVEPHPDKPGRYIVHGSASCDTCGGTGMPVY